MSKTHRERSTYDTVLDIIIVCVTTIGLFSFVAFAIDAFVFELLYSQTLQEVIFQDATNDPS